MGHSLYFLTATWLAAQGIEPQAVMPGTMNRHCSSCQDGMNQHMQPMQSMGSSRRYFGNQCQGNQNQGSQGLFQRMGNRFRGIVDWCRGESDDDYSQNMQNMNQMNNANHMNNMNNMNNMNQMSQSQRGQPTTYPIEMNTFPINAKMSEPPLADTVQGQQGQKSAPKNLAPINFRPQDVGKGNISPRMTDKVGHETDFSWITGQLRRENGRWTIHFATPETVDRFQGRLPIAPGPDMSRFQEGDLVTAHGQVNTRGGQPMYQASSVDLIEHDAK